MTRFICIGGKAMSGKDTAAGMLKLALENQGYKVLITHYADLLKFICRNYFGWDGTKDEYGRSLLQHVGTDMVRNQRPDYWVNFILDMAGFFEGEWDYIILPDARFKNELSKIEESGYKMFYIRMRRLDFENTLTEEQKNHPSETSLNSVVPNVTLINRTLEQLRLDIEALCPAICNWFDVVNTSGQSVLSDITVDRCNSSGSQGGEKLEGSEKERRGS